ncbi:lysylphosphatidylglycerol synthase transmembrane domain-containing protein [Hymenobacter canadensis]|uniref:Lysylphosphatidylglycerol synthase transmembrane domain-containing protein n=1 Tax=Hymenobacter canadensis TaxID=2999067 RepID=A0ABY7LNL9_9BACT|nr:lysylphosphatidylglycerol synthase transmembrane domain-containing protein [Hymenobacter canadensis]WBA41199.1 lysylphosphatidylglycerol synthase transmembrane domain-containing protein [Hymenobacter canadensis]
MKQLLNILKYALLLSVSGLLMWYAVRGQDLSRIVDTVRGANYWWLMLTMVLSVLGYLSRAYRWKMQLDPTVTGPKPAFWDVYHAMMVGNLANMVLPGRVGEVVRCSLLQRTSKVPVQVSLGTVITERVIDVLVLLGLLTTVLLLDFKTFWGFADTYLLQGKADALARNRNALVAAAVVALLALLISGYLLWRNLERLRQNTVFNKMLGFVKGLLAGVFSIVRMENKGTFLLHTFFTWLVYYLMDYLAFFAFPETYDLGMRAALAVLTFGAFGMAAPVQGGIGVFHLLVQSTLLVYGISKEGGIAYALVVHGAQTLLVVLMGGISFLLSMMKSGQLARRGVALPLETTELPADVEQR